MAIADAFQQNARRDPFYSFNRFQKEHGKDMSTAPAIGGPSGYLENNPNVSYNRYLASLGIGQADMSPFAQWAQKQFNNAQLGYQTALAEDPTMTFQQYLPRLGFSDMYNTFMRLSPNQRGESRSRFVGPVRTISDI